MQNKLYPKRILIDLMKQDRLNASLSQDQIGKLIKRNQRQVSDIENGYINPTPELMIKWFSVLEEYEHIDLVHHLFDLHPLASIPVDPDLNKDVGFALINLEEQIDEAVANLKSIRKWISNFRPNRIYPVGLDAWKEVYDVHKAIQSLLYAGKRQFDVDLDLLKENWNNKAANRGVGMQLKHITAVGG